MSVSLLVTGLKKDWLDTAPNESHCNFPQQEMKSRPFVPFSDSDDSSRKEQLPLLQQK
jgi:hypothetical protein